MAPRTRAPNAGSPNASVFPSAARSEKAAGMIIIAPPAAITAPNALAITLGCKEALYLVDCGLDGEHHRVVSGLEHLFAGGDDDVSVPQERPDDGAFGEPHLRERTTGDPASFGDPKLYHLGPALQQGYVYDLSLAHESEYGFGGQHPG